MRLGSRQTCELDIPKREPFKNLFSGALKLLIDNCHEATGS